MIRRLFLVVLSLVLASSSSLLAYSGGGGTTSNPYQISTESDLYDLSQNPSDWSSSFVITANLDLSSYPNITIGTSSTPFTGTFNGGNVTADYAYRDGRDIAVEGYAITGYSISATNSNIGLFGYIGVGGDVRNIFLIDPIVQGGSSSDSVGAICGYNKGTISDCTAIKSVSASDDQVNVSGDDRVGGICGQNDAGDIIGCYSYLYVKADSEVAGIVGYQKNSGSVYQSCSGGHIEGTSVIAAKVAGIVGNNNAGNLTDCYSEADLTGSKYAGGIIGINTGGTITNCYFADGTIACDSYEGALVGDRNSGTFVGCLYDSSLGLDAIGDGSYTGMVGKTKEELCSTATYEDAGFDFETAWLILDTADYARLDGVGVQLADLPNITPAITSQLLFSANAGTSFSISFQDSNNGTIAAGAYTSKLYFNTSDSDWDSLLATVGDATTATPGYIEMSAISGLSVGADYSETFNVIANSSIDNMYFRVYSDTNHDVT